MDEFSKTLSQGFSDIDGRSSFLGKNILRAANEIVNLIFGEADESPRTTTSTGALYKN